MFRELWQRVTRILGSGAAALALLLSAASLSACDAPPGTFESFDESPRGLAALQRLLGEQGTRVRKRVSSLSDFDEDGLAYDRNAPGFAWQSDPFTWSQLGAMMATDSRTDVGTLLEIEFKRGVSGRAYCVTLVGNERTVNVSGAVFKTVFNRTASGPNLKSNMFFLEAGPTS